MRRVDQPRGEPIRRKLGIAALVVVLLAAAVYARPLSFLFLYRDVVLWIRGVESRTVEAGGHRIHMLSQGEGEALVILPGLLSTAHDASPLLDAFARRRRAIAVDLLGQGRSSRPDIAYSISDQSNAVIAVLDQARLGPVDLLGVSMGGWIALDVAAKRPDLVRRLILAGSAGLRFETDLTPEFFAPQDVVALNRLVERQSARPARLPAFLARDSVRRLRANEWVTLRAARSMITWREAYDRRLGVVHAPTLVYWGREDRIIPLEAGRRLAAGIAGARLVVGDGCGHLAVLECRDHFVGAVEAFLAAPRRDQRN